MSSQGDLRQTLLHRAQELFALCDREDKGYAFKDELGALGEELPLSPEQLESVFDVLDADGDGKLTLQEFSDGFGMFLGIESQPRNCVSAISPEDEDEDEDEELEELLDHLGARNLFTDEDYVREMWHRVRKDDPVMRSNFENFISRMTADLRLSADEKESLQSTLKSREQENECRVQSLYAEMEEQLRQEKEEALAREQWKEQRLRDELETELQFKDQQLQEVLQKHSQMQKQLQDLNSGEVETKYENKKLQKDRDVLESQLTASERMLQDMKNQQNLLRKKSLEEKRKRAHAALKVSEGIALERENLVLELQNLKEMNKQLLDEKDELEQTTAQLIEKSPKFPHRTVGPKRKDQTLDLKSNGSIESVNGPVRQSNPVTLDRMLAEAHPLETGVFRSRLKYQNSISRSDSDCEEDTDLEEKIIQNNLNLPVQKTQSEPRRNVRPRLRKSFEETLPKIDERVPETKTIDELSALTRVFKVVFVGDSGVGKTCILQRFCNEDFKPTFSATIGVDFQIKTVNVDGERIVLQLWDTAGQERFRSMTQQYFRKADGIVVVYDVTSEITFRSVRNWMHSIKEGAEDNAMVLLIGNKTDMCQSDEDRVVRAKDGEKMADEFSALFFETSAKTGSCIQESLVGLACVLKSKEDETIEQVLKLQEAMKEKKKKKCC